MFRESDNLRPSGASARAVTRWMFILAGFLSASVSSAEIFRCVDDAGRTVFKDKKCNESEELIKTLGETGQVKLPDDNLLQNSAFEKELTGWTVEEGIRWADTGGVDGGGALVIQAKKPPEDKYIYETVAKQCVPIGKGDKFELKAQVKIDGPVSKVFANRANVSWYQSPDCRKGGEYGMYIEPKNETGWQTISRANLSPSLNARAALVRIVQRGRYSEGVKAYWDNISLTPRDIQQNASDEISDEAMQLYTLPPGKNYVINAGFVENTSSWRTSGKWSGETGDSTPGSIRITLTSKRGGYGTGVMSQCVNVGNNTRFDAGVSFKRDSTSDQDGGGRFRIIWYEKLNCTGRSRYGDDDDPKKENGWQKLRINNLKRVKNSRSARLEMIQSIKGNGSFSVFWDDAFFRSIGPAQ